MLGEGNNAEKLVFSSFAAPICIPCVALTPKPNWLQQCIYEQPLNPGSNFSSVPGFIWIVVLQYKFVLKLDLAFTHKVDLVKMFFTSEGVRVRSSKQCRVKITKFQVQISAAGKTEDELAERDLRIVQCAMCNVECAMCNGRGDILC